MKYLLRSVKYFITLSVVFVLLVAALVLLKFVDADIQTMFRSGWDSVWQIAIIITVFAIIYPRFGYCSRIVRARGSFEETRENVVSFMQERGYVMKSLQGETMVFRSGFPLTRVLRLGEDRVTVSHSLSGYELEGRSKDVLRLASALETRFEIPIC